MSQRFARELQEEMPEVDAFIGLDQVPRLGEIVEKMVMDQSHASHRSNATNNDLDLGFAETRPIYIPDYDTPRFRLTPAHSAYVKIAEGCNHPCSFCVIPQMRGKHRSRAPQSVLSEIRGLVSEGVREINLISQDTTYYGMDLWTAKAGPRQPVDSTRGPTLAGLLREIQEIEGDFWVRLLYTHPAHWSDELIETIAQCDKVARYIDIPLQHIDDSMLGRMRRETSRQHIEDLIQRLRGGITGVSLRTTFIVGFPGETDADFEMLLEWLDEASLDRVGCFKYEPVRGAAANDMAAPVPDDVKDQRWHRFMQAQQKISTRRLKRKVGSRQKVIIDNVGPSVAKGRSMADAPEIDGAVYIAAHRPLRVGEITTVKIERADEYDLHGTAVGF